MLAVNHMTPVSQKYKILNNNKKHNQETKNN